MFGHIARDLVAGGFMVVRYDKRGVGQSGGRAESATIADYAEDARAVVLWLEKRKDVDKDRIALVGHSEGAWVAMLTAGARARQGRGAALLGRAVSATAASSCSNSRSSCCRRCRSTMRSGRRRWRCRTSINTAVIKGTGWDDIPEPARRVADTPWFHSFLTFDPERR